jgi:hypothetical protein
MVEGENPFMDYKELLAKSVPKIRERLRTVENLDTKAIDVEVKKDFNGMI